MFMKKLFSVLTACLLIVFPLQAQCDLEFDFVNTGSNMTAFFTPPAAAAIYSDLGEGQVGAFYVNVDGSYVCGSSATFTGNQIQLAVMGDDATTPSKDGFSSGEVINWFYKSNDGAVHSLGLNPADNFVINAMTFISSASSTAIDCNESSDVCPPLVTEFLNTGSNMTLFLTPPAATALSALGDGVIAVYFDSNGVQVCGGSTNFSGSSAQIAANGDDATTAEKDGFSAGESISWKFEDNTGNQYNLTPTPSDNFSLNGISFVSGFDFSPISCSVDVEGCTDNSYLEYNASANIDDGSCLTIAIPGCTNQDYIEYNSLANLDDGSCNTLIVNGCTDAMYLEFDDSATVDDGSCSTFIVEGCIDSNYVEYNSSANVDDGSCLTMSLDGCTDTSACNYNVDATTDNGSCYNNDLGCGCDTPGADDGYDCDGNCLADADNDGVCDEFEVSGCQDASADNYNADSTDSGYCEYSGCTDSAFLEYDEVANTDDGSCSTIIVGGCTDSNATNFDSSANTSDGSCEYDLIGAGCSVSFISVENSGNNHTVFLTPGAVDGAPLSSGDDIGVFYISEDGSAQCAGSSIWNGDQLQITVFGDDATTDEIDGFTSGAPLLLLAQSGDDIYMVSASYQTPSMSTFVVNGISFVMGLDFESACTVEYLGCTDSAYLEYDETANTDDGSCSTFIVEGCTDSNYVEYNSSANVDDGSCLTMSLDGCTDTSACNYNVDATTDNGSCYNNDLGCGCDTPGADDGYDCDGNCLADADNDGVCDEFEVSGCQDASADNYNADSTDSGYCEYSGCTDSAFLEYDEVANTDDGSCSTIIVGGCTDSNATNFDSSANTSDGSCEYDLIGAGCDVNFETVNTGSNHTIMIPSSLSSTLNIGDQIGVFFIGENGSAICAGSSVWSGNVLQIVAFGDDTTTDEVDGLLSGASFLFLAQSGDDVYVVNATFQSPSMANYVVNGLSFVADLQLELACSVEHLGCIDVNACNYDSSANTDDNSCEYAVQNLDCNGVCINDSDNDGICNEFEIAGCMDTSASNYNSDATDGDNSCISWEEAYDSCVESGGDDGITQDDVDAVQNLLNVANLSLSYAENNILSLESELNTALANQEDGVSQADIDAIQTQLDAANTNVSSLNYVITNLESEISESNASIITLEAQIEEILANCGDDGVTQADVDAVQELLDLASISITDLQSELVYALANQEDGITQADVAAVQALLDQSIVDLNIALANQEDGIGQAEVDAAYADGASSVTPEDGVSQADVDAIQVLLDDALANTGGGSCEAIYVDLLSGWNIVGYTLTFSQDVAATLDPIVEDVQIVKDNSANVYWPEYGFNGIGDFIPGQGYQIRMHNEVSSYTFPDVDGLRIDLTETVPAYVYDLPILNHPNDIKSLVKVVNMLGQEVNPTNQFTGEVLLYLFNDGTTEKRIVE